MIKLMDLIREVSLNATYNDAGEPDTGFLPKGKVRKLGIKSNKPEPWFEKGGYVQWSFPKATNIYDKKDKSQQRIQVIKKVKNTGVKYDNFQEDVGSWDKYGNEDYSTNYDISDILDD